MTTQSWSSVADHLSDANFRTWGSEVNARLAACGLVQTADTGQINWVTVNRPGASTVAGYEIWRFDDSLQGSAPIFIRINYGTGPGTTIPEMQATVGTGTNGSGTITGTALTIARVFTNGSAPATGVSYNSFACHISGFLGLAWKQSPVGGFFSVTRTCDNTGTPTGDGALVQWSRANGVAVQPLRFAATAQAFTAVTQCQCLVPFSVGSSLVGSDIQVYMHWLITPQVRPVFGMCTVINSEVPRGTSFSATLVGSTARTYLALGTDGGPGSVAVGSTYCVAMLYE